MTNCEKLSECLVFTSLSQTLSKFLSLPLSLISLQLHPPHQSHQPIELSEFISASPSIDYNAHSVPSSCLGKMSSCPLIELINNSICFHIGLFINSNMGTQLFIHKAKERYFSYLKGHSL